jgi:hypothetical protein
VAEVVGVAGSIHPGAPIKTRPEMQVQLMVATVKVKAVVTVLVAVEAVVANLVVQED